MKELTTSEIEHVSGAGFWADVGAALGFLHGSATQMQQQIDSTEKHHAWRNVSRRLMFNRC